MKQIVSAIYRFLRARSPGKYFFRFFWDPVKTRINLLRYSRMRIRKLEIGCSGIRLEGFETLSVVGGRHIDYVVDASKRLPFANNSFDLIYASHVLEHIPWYVIPSALKEWNRILKSSGELEVWVPNGLALCSALVEAERNGTTESMLCDGWYKFNSERNPFVWVNGRMFAYGDGTGSSDSPNWHRALLTPAYLDHLFKEAGFCVVKEMNSTEVRGADHGWINLGVKGIKK